MKTLAAYIRLARPHHWIKNGFVLVSAFFAGDLHNPEVLGLIGKAFLLFCFLSSAIYVFNDLTDHKVDNTHAKKKARPLPAAEVSRAGAMALFTLLLLLSAGLLWLIKPTPLFSGIVILYTITNVFYSLGLKKIPVLELFMVASGYMFRLAAGAAIIHEPLTGWIIITTGLVTLLMAAGKRRGDLVQANGSQKTLKGYTVAYLDQIISMLAAATIVAYLLFCISDYATARFGPYIMGSSVFVLYGILRYMQILTVENGGDSPTMVVYRDKPILITIALFTLFFAVNIYMMPR